MFNALTEQARTVMSLAADEARQLNHEYVGTEHILLGLLREGSSDAVGALRRLGVSVDAVRGEIEKLVQRGPNPPTAAQLPLTPRAKRVLEFASESAADVSLPRAGPEHLLIGLLREPSGVAGMAMRNLGLELRKVCDEALKTRISQMRIVERAVRPVRASVKHKRKMREELLAHLGAIYDEELARANDPAVALDSATRRFGDPAELARELQASLPGSERRAYAVERWLGWRAPESVARMMARTSFISFLIIAVLVGVPVVAGIVFQGWDQSQLVALRVLAAMAVLTPAAQFFHGLCYYRARNSIFGVFGARKSLLNGILWSLLAAIAVFAVGVGFVAIVEGSVARAGNSLIILSLISMFWAIVCPILVRVRGPIEIRDTLWATLQLETSS